MHKSAWGNVNDPHVYIDPETRNNAYRPKTNILRVAQSLIHLGEKKKAMDLMDLFFKYFPCQKFSLDMDDAIFANLYYKAGEVEKANKMVEMMAKFYSDNLEYYYSFTGWFADHYKDDIQNSLEMLHSLQMLATQNKQDKLAKQMESIFNREADKFKQ
jgi:tetratricopeptide (TPR) repeat protein